MGENEELTHYGQSLPEIEKFEPQDDSDPDEDGNISGKNRYCCAWHLTKKLIKLLSSKSGKIWALFKSSI